jgi:hypothetical protein
MGTDLDNGRLLRHKNSERKLLRTGFNGTLGFVILSLMDGIDDRLEGTKAGIAYEQREPGSYLVVDFQSTLVHLNSDQFLCIAREACGLTNAGYGIGYVRPFGHAPLEYGMPLSYNPYSDEEARRITQWMVAPHAEVCLQGLMRDVYPRNFLSAPHLARQIGDVRFDGWVRRSAHNGTLALLTDTITLWEVPTESIPAVRQTLVDAGMVFDYERDIVAKLPAQPEEITGEEALRRVLEGFGVQGPQDARVLEVEQPGKTRELSSAEIKKITRKKTPRKE